MTSNLLKVGGAVVFWSVGKWTSRERLAEGLKDLGLERYAPEPRTDAAALRDALEEVFPKHLVRPLRTRDGFAVVEEVRGHDENEYAHLYTARVEPSANDLAMVRVKLSAPPPPKDDVRAAWTRHRGLLGAAQVGACLVNVVEGLGGTRLRPSGGIYWLPEHLLEKWAALAQAVEGAAAFSKHALYTMRHAMDADAVKAVRDAICHEVLAEAARLKEEIQSGGLGERAVEGRRGQAAELRQKVELYEGLLNVGLSELKKACEEAELAEAAATILLSAAGGA